MDKKIFVSLVNGSAAAAETETTAMRHIVEMLHGVSVQQIEKAKDNGEVRSNVRIRTLHINLER